MSSEVPPPSDDDMLAAHATALADALAVDLPAWAARQVSERLPEAMDDAAAVAAKVDAELTAALRELLAADIDAQTTTPLALARRAVAAPTAVLAAAGVAPVERDEFARRAFPDDPYGLTPASFADISERVGQLGLVWGAAKAHVHLARRRAEGQR